MEDKSLTPLSSALLSSIIYFSLFKHPLTLSELASYCHFYEARPEEIQESLHDLLNRGIIDRHVGYYFLKGENGMTDRRHAGEIQSSVSIKKARFYSKLIASFPFVRAVFISGSLSKGYMDKNSDIDYFIITKPGRLWVCRTLLVLFKKTILFNSHKHFCVNYFIDTENLQIPDQNIFTATELVFILPMYNSSLYRQFRKANPWTYRFYPNMHNEKRAVAHDYREHRFRNLAERLLSGNAGEWLDNWCFKKTISHWKIKFSDFDDTAFDLKLRSRKNVSKHHPRGFQQKVLNRYEDKIKLVEKKYQLQLTFGRHDQVKESMLF